MGTLLHFQFRDLIFVILLYPEHTGGLTIRNINDKFKGVWTFHILSHKNRKFYEIVVTFLFIPSTRIIFFVSKPICFSWYRYVLLWCVSDCQWSVNLVGGQFKDWLCFYIPFRVKTKINESNGIQGPAGRQGKYFLFGEDNDRSKNECYITIGMTWLKKY